MAHIVKTGSGSIRGMHEESVLAFCGIPYPQPPIGPLRFRPPHKPLAWAWSSVATPSCACCTVLPLSDVATPQVLGVDDWASRKGQIYGTALIDRERR